VEISAGLFLVANDEDNVLRFYRTGKNGAALFSSRSLSAELGAIEQKGKARELDIEGAAALGERIYLIGSHGRSRKTGKARPTRQRLFAITIDQSPDSNRFTTDLAGDPYTTLIPDLMARFGQDDSVDWLDLETAAMRAPGDPGGLNIEGLSATADGSGLLIGMRNPLGPDGRAILIPLTNPAGTLEGQPGVFGKPLTVDLSGRGIRSIDYVDAWKRYVIVAGPPGDDGDYAVFSWSGSGSTDPLEIPLPWGDETTLTPEALFYSNEDSSLHVLSDDGRVTVTRDGKTKRCKDWSMHPSVQFFRELAIDYSPSPDAPR